MNKLTICITFCDKDYQYVLRLLTQIEQHICVSYSLVLIDNRKTKDVLSYQDKITFCCEGEGCLIPRKKALAYINSEYVWYIDADDEIINDITEDLFSSKADIISFKCIDDTGKLTTGTEPDRTLYDYNCGVRKITFKVHTYMKLGPTLWNKFIKTSVFKKIDKIEDFICVCNEDAFLITYFMKKAKTYIFLNKILYKYNTLLGDVKADIVTFEKFNRICKGAGKLFEVLPKHFSSKRVKQIDMWISPEASCISLLKLISKSDPSIVNKELEELHKEFSTEIIQRAFRKYVNY